MNDSLDPLNHDRILAALTEPARVWLRRLDVFSVLDSTNSYLLAGATAGWQSGSVCLADQQTAGRGRQGRTWLTPPGGSLAFSLLWRFARPAAALSGLSLVTGIAVVRALRKWGVFEVGLKWPNDIWWRTRKLGGILLESGGGMEQFYVVAGVGLNVALPLQAALSIDQPWVDLQTIIGNAVGNRNALAALLISEVITAFTQFEKEGFDGFVAEWMFFDQMRGQRVRLQLPNGVVAGIYRGVDRTGALLLETSDGQVTAYLGGEIRLRMET